MPMINYSITNRDFYFLIDSSASMLKPLAIRNPQKRFGSIREAVEGHITDVLSHSRDEDSKLIYPENIKKVLSLRNEDSKLIYPEVVLAFFNTNKVSKKIYMIDDCRYRGIGEIFSRDIFPQGDTYIAPTFTHLMSQWLENRKQSGTDAAVVIYVDGLVDDLSEFVSEIKNVTSQLEHHSHLKILIIGIGEAINNQETLEKYFELDLNVPAFTDANGEPSNVVIFNRMDDVNDLGGIIPAMEVSSIENPASGLPLWLAEEFPDLYQKLKQKYDLE